MRDQTNLLEKVATKNIHLNVVFKLQNMPLKQLKSLFPDLNESTVCGFQKKYLDQMKIAEKRSRSPEKLMVNLQLGRSLLLSNDIDEKMRKYIRLYATQEDRQLFN